MTRAPLFSRISTYPSAASRRRTSRTGVREIPIFLTQLHLVEILVGLELERQNLAFERIAQSGFADLHMSLTK